MHHARRLGLRIATLLLATGSFGIANIVGCGGVETNSGGSTGNASTSTSSGNASSSGSSSGAVPMCEFGTPARQCFTLAQIEDQINNPFPGGDIDPDAGVDGGDVDAGPDGGGVMLTECPEPSIVRDGCCNPGVSGPEMDGELCCYYFCTGACCGRMFTIEHEARVAETTTRADWCTEWSFSPNDLDDATRRALADAWRSDAQMEHASIASFARFTMELLALGAPADLVSASQSASLDEVAHAQLCFGLASRFSGKATGPGPLDMTGALRGTNLAECAGWTVIEGCIGETIAALTARAQLEMAQDEGVRQALLRIAEDEEQHAALAWRFVAWAISVGGTSVRAAVAQAFEDGMRQVRAHRYADVSGVNEETWHDFGRLTSSELDRVAEQAFVEAIAPNAGLLLGAPNHPSAAVSNTFAYT